MIIDTYTVNVRYRIDQQSLRVVQNQLRRIQTQARNLNVNLNQGYNRGAGGTGSSYSSRRNNNVSAFAAPVFNAAGLNSFQASIGQLSLRFGALGVAAGAVTLALSSISDSVKVASTFESKMVDIKAVLGDEKEAKYFDKLNDKIRQLGRDSALTANEVARGGESLLKAGTEPENLLGDTGALAASSYLAIAMNTDMERTGKLLAKTTAQFGLEGSDMLHTADLIAGATLRSTFNFNDMSIAVGQAGAAAGAAGIDFEDFVTMLAATSHAFNGGSDAGTSLKVFLQRLTGISGPAVDALKDLGLTTKEFTAFFDKTGTLKNAEGLFAVMRRSMVKTGVSAKKMNELAALSPADFKKMKENTPEDFKTEFDIINRFGKAFGMDAWRTAFALAMQGAEGFTTKLKAINEVKVIEVQQKKLESYDGQMRLLTSAWTDFKLELVNQDVLNLLTSGLKSMTQSVKDLTAWWTQATIDAKPYLAELKNIWSFFSEKMKPMIDWMGNNNIYLPKLIMGESWKLVLAAISKISAFVDMMRKDDAIAAAKAKLENGERLTNAESMLADQNISKVGSTINTVKDGFKTYDKFDNKITTAMDNLVGGVVDKLAPKNDVVDTLRNLLSASPIGEFFGGNSPASSPSTNHKLGQSVVDIKDTGNVTVNVTVDGAGGAVASDARNGARQGVTEALGVRGGLRGQNEMTNSILQALGGG